MSAIWRKSRRFLIQKVLHTNDTPHQIAVGVAVGIFVGLTPTVGFQMVIAVAIAAALRANKAICIPMVWITNPITLVPIYAACFQIGVAIMGPSRPVQADPLAPVVVLDAGSDSAGIQQWFHLDFWKDLLLRATKVCTELWVGCLFVASVAALIAYFATRWGVSAYREQRRQKIAARELLRIERRRRSKSLPARRPSV